MQLGLINKDFLRRDNRRDDQNVSILYFLVIQTLLLSVDMKTSIQEISWHLIAYYHHAEKYSICL